MSFRAPPRPTSMTLNLAPMVDVMMCLIIFFLLASKMVAADLNPVNLPWARAARSVSPSELGERITITVASAPGAEAVEYIVAEWDGKAIVRRRLEPHEVSDLLKARTASASGGAAPKCVVRADRTVRYADVEVVLRACGAAKIADVVFSVNEGAAPGEG